MTLRIVCLDAMSQTDKIKIYLLINLKGYDFVPEFQSSARGDQTQVSGGHAGPHHQRAAGKAGGRQREAETLGAKPLQAM